MIRADFLAGAGAAAGVAFAQPPTPYTATLRFAVVCPQSGPDGRIGRQLLDGVRAAVDELNNERTSLERFLVYDAYDDHNTAADATVQASFATGNPETQAVIGHLSSGTTLVAEPAYANAQIALIVPTVTDDRVTSRGYRNVFRLPTKDSDEGSLVAAYAITTGSKAPHVAVQVATKVAAAINAGGYPVTATPDMVNAGQLNLYFAADRDVRRITAAIVTTTGLTAASSSPRPSRATNSHAARSARVFDLA